MPLHISVCIYQCMHTSLFLQINVFTCHACACTCTNKVFRGTTIMHMSSFIYHCTYYIHINIYIYIHQCLCTSTSVDIIAFTYQCFYRTLYVRVMPITSQCFYISCLISESSVARGAEKKWRWRASRKERDVNWETTRQDRVKRGAIMKARFARSTEQNQIKTARSADNKLRISREARSKHKWRSREARRKEDATTGVRKKIFRAKRGEKHNITIIPRETQRNKSWVRAKRGRQKHYEYPARSAGNN